MIPRRRPLPFRYLEPTFFAGLFDDPVLFLHVRPTGRAALVDCGQIHHLAKRVVKAVDTIFITHAHMDHFMGMDSFIRQVHVSPRTIGLYGPPGIATRLAHKLAGYEWNLAESNWCSFRVREISDEQIRTFILAGAESFSCREESRHPRCGRIIHDGRFFTAEADLGDHKTPVLMFRFNEKPSFRLDPHRIDRAGLIRGPWIGELNRLFFRGGLEGKKVRVVRRRGDRQLESEEDAEEVYRDIRRIQSPASIGYVTDVGYTPENRRRILDLLQDVDLLFCECAYLQEGRDKARLSYHLCTDDLNRLLGDLRPARVVPMHLSKTYLRRSRRLYKELHPPSGVTLLRLPQHVTPRPLLPSEVAAGVVAREEDALE